MNKSKTIKAKLIGLITNTEDCFQARMSGLFDIHPLVYLVLPVESEVGQYTAMKISVLSLSVEVHKLHLDAASLVGGRFACQCLR